MPTKSNDILHTSLNLTEKQWETLIATLEAGKGPTVPATRDRRDLDVKRYPHVRRVALRVIHTGGQKTSHLVRSRNLSVGGMGFIHLSFLYPGTVCHVALQTRHGESVALAGKVSWCRHVSGQSHEIGLRFDQLIQIDEFIDLEALDDPAAA
ncbi:MAG: PilZ domain-containing protein [Planctomycetota bacterium]